MHAWVSIGVFPFGFPTKILHAFLTYVQLRFSGMSRDECRKFSNVSANTAVVIFRVTVVHKRSVVIVLMDTTKTTCDKTNQASELQHIHFVLRASGYSL
jgi:hypothetical protein